MTNWPISFSMWECNENIVVGAIGFVGNLINFDVRDAFKAWKLSGVCNWRNIGILPSFKFTLVDSSSVLSF